MQHRYPGGWHGSVPVAGEATICSPLWFGLGAGEIDRYGDNADWAADQREDDAGSLVCIGQPHYSTYEILGTPQLQLRLRSDKPQARVTVRVNKVFPDDTSTRVSLGLSNLTTASATRTSYQRPVQLTCAQLLVVIEVTVLGSFAKKFHALQQASTISS